VRRAVRPNSIVLDIGRRYGHFQFARVQIRARAKSMRSEPSSALTVADEAARANGFADRMECLQTCSTEISLPQKADIIISDCARSAAVIPTTSSLYHRRAQRLLAPGGNLIPKTRCPLGRGRRSAAITMID